MHAAARQLPDEPCVDRAEQQFAALRPLPCARNVFKDPAQLRAGKIRVDDEPGFLPDPLGQAAPAQLVAVFRRPSALPDNGRIDGLAVPLIPDDSRFALVRDADALDVLRPRADLSHGFLRNAQLRIPNLYGIVLHPAGLRIGLRKFLLCDAADLAPAVEQNAAIARRAGIERHDILCHRYPSA